MLRYMANASAETGCWTVAEWKNEKVFFQERSRGMKIFHSPHLILHKVYVDSNRALFVADRLRKPHVASKELRRDKQQVQGVSKPLPITTIPVLWTVPFGLLCNMYLVIFAICSYMICLSFSVTL